MRLSTPATSAAAALLLANGATAQFALVTKLLNTFGLSKPLDCALPCVLDSANRMPCDEDGAAATICRNVNAIEERTRPCVERCQAQNAAGR